MQNLNCKSNLFKHSHAKQKVVSASNHMASSAINDKFDEW